MPFQIDHFDDLLDDTERWLTQRRSVDNDAPFFVLAHSMGALISVVLAARGGFDASTRDADMRAIAFDDPLHADVEGVPAVLYYAFSVLLLPMQRTLGWSRSTLVGGFTVAAVTRPREASTTF